MKYTVVEVCGRIQWTAGVYRIKSTLCLHDFVTGFVLTFATALRINFEGQREVAVPLSESH